MPPIRTEWRPGIVGRQSIVKAAEGLAGVAFPTPLVPLWGIDPVAPGHHVRVKPECLQPIGAFKLRGAFTMMSRLNPAVLRRGVITYSSGNHGQGVAFAAQRFGIPCVVVVPTDAATVKVDGIRRWGAEVVVHGSGSTERRMFTEAFAAEHGMTVVPPYDHPDVVAGQGTIGLEITRDWHDVQAVLVPVGAGGLVSGVAAWIRQSAPKCIVVGVEPKDADVVSRSRSAGHAVALPTSRSIADALRSDATSDLIVTHVTTCVDEMITVSDDDIRGATGLLLREYHLVSEYSGAIAVAAIASGTWRTRGRRTVAVVSGGNIDRHEAATLLYSELNGPSAVTAMDQAIVRPQGPRPA